MTAYAARLDGAWVELRAGDPVRLHDAELDDIITWPYEAIFAWSPQFRTARGVKPIVEAEIPAGKVSTSSTLADVDGKPSRVWTLEDTPAPDMPALRQAAFASAMAYGNAITAKIVGTYSDAEARTWAIQEAEARALIAGDALQPSALLPGLAADKGVPLADYATGVVAKADSFKAIVRAAVVLRRGAEGLRSEAIGTPAALADAVEALREQTHAAAQALGLPI